MSNNQAAKIELYRAINKLEEFVNRKENILPLPLQKTIQLIKSSFLPETQDSLDLLKAIEVIKRERFHIQNLQNGSQEDQQLVAAYETAVEKFNETVAESIENEKKYSFIDTLFSRIKPTVLPIDLPLPFTITSHFPTKPALVEKISQTALTLSLSRQSVDLFHMKVLALLEKYGLASNPEARNVVKQTPIQMLTHDEHAVQCTLLQTIKLFPGQTIHVKGHSKMDPKTQTICTLFPETFSLSIESTQTGFPHPAQRNGWALAYSLIPDCPHRVDLLPALHEHFEKKKQIIQELHFPKPLWKKAKQLLKSKKKVFDENREEFLKLHTHLAFTIMSASQSESIPDAVINNYITNVFHSASSYETIAETYQTINENFLIFPFVELSRKCIEQFDAKPSLEEAKHILETAYESSYMKIEKSKRSQVELDFIFLIGSIFAKGAFSIILQYFSETLLCPPPLLTAFEKQLQSMAVKQGVDFFDELYHFDAFNDPDQLKTYLVDQLQKDIQLFNEQNVIIANSWENYFSERFLAFNNI